MSVTYIPEWTKLCLWGKAAGRCQYTGCNRPLYRDDHTKAEFNSAYIAHIIADKPDGPRGDSILSEQLKQDLSNLMLVCDVHHRLIDRADVAGHPAARLQRIKREHEERMELLTSIQEECHSHILLYGAKIGEHNSPLTFQKAATAMVSERYPAAPRAIELGLKGTAFGDHETEYWSMEVEQLRRQFANDVRPRLKSNEISHLSVFAIAPIPLLIELGRLLSDIPAADVFQLHREPADWKWREDPASIGFKILPPAKKDTEVALVLALSADIALPRVHAVLGESAAIWTITHDRPGNDFLQSKAQLRAFRESLRDALNQIHAAHSDASLLHVFPAIPVSAAVEIGRVWMPKADLPLRIYDQNRATGGFTYVTDVTHTANIGVHG